MIQLNDLVLLFSKRGKKRTSYLSFIGLLGLYCFTSSSVIICFCYLETLRPYCWFKGIGIILPAAKLQISPPFKKLNLLLPTIDGKFCPCAYFFDLIPISVAQQILRLFWFIHRGYPFRFLLLISKSSFSYFYPLTPLLCYSCLCHLFCIFIEHLFREGLRNINLGSLVEGFSSFKKIKVVVPSYRSRTLISTKITVFH